MIINFSEAELNTLTIQPCERRERPPLYLEEREKVWDAQMARVLARNGNMWNGEIYTLEEIQCPGEEQVILRISTCEYKDLVFRMLKGDGYITGHFGEEHVVRFCGVNVVPVTLDGKFVFGIRADRPEQGKPPVGGIGGTLNKDEMEIHSYADIRLHALHELQEETALECKLADLRFFGLLVATNSFHFAFAVRLLVHSDEINQYFRQGEFSRLVALNEEEAYAISTPMTHTFRRWRPLLQYIPGILKQTPSAGGRQAESG